MPIVNSGDSWSPDGTRIAYRSNHEEISVVDVRSGESRVLTSDTSRSLSDPLWSPDGEHIAIHETEQDKPPVLLVVDLEGREVARYADWIDGQQGYAWSPDGSRIAFASYNDDLKSAWLSIATLGESPTTIATAGSRNRFLGIRWSPRGTYLGWTFDEDLHLLDLATNQETTFPLDGSPVYGHAWLPNEDGVVVWSNKLFTMHPDGSNLRMIDSEGHNASVEPTTGRILWTTGHSVGEQRVIVSAPDGSDQRVVLTTAQDAAIDGVMWSPTGRRFLFIEYA